MKTVFSKIKFFISVSSEKIKDLNYSSKISRFSYTHTLTLFRIFHKFKVDLVKYFG